MGGVPRKVKSTLPTKQIVGLISSLSFDGQFQMKRQNVPSAPTTRTVYSYTFYQLKTVSRMGICQSRQQILWEYDINIIQCAITQITQGNQQTCYINLQRPRRGKSSSFSTAIQGESKKSYRLYNDMRSQPTVKISWQHLYGSNLLHHPTPVLQGMAILYL